MKLEVQNFQDYNTTTRVFLHVAMWAGMFCLLLLLLKLPLQGNAIDLSFLIFIAAMLCIIAINHYIIAYGLVWVVQKGNWFIVGGSLACLYLFSAYASSLCLAQLAHFFQDNKMLHMLYVRYRISGVTDFVTLNTFTWVMSFIFPFCMFTLFLKFYKKNHDTSRKNLYLQKTNSELELSFLRAQINPHFFFNTLNSLYALVFDNERAAKVVLDLSDIMRFSLYEARAPRITMSREVKFLTDYIQLEKLRHGDRVSIEHNFVLNGHGDNEILPLLLVNFIENAFKHGVHNTVDRAWVDISLFCREGTVVFKVENSKPSLQKTGEAVLGIGLENVKRRLDIVYPGQHELKIVDTSCTFTVLLSIQVK